MATDAVRRLPSLTECHRAANNLTTKKRVIIRENGRVGDGIRMAHYTPRHGSWLDLAESELGVKDLADLHFASAKQIVLVQDNLNIHGAKEGGFVVFMHGTRRINVHQMPEDRGLRWKRSRVFQYLFKRKLIVPCECNAICEASRLPADFLQPKFLVGRITVHHCHGLRRCSTAVKTIGVVAKRSCRWRWTKATAGAPTLTIRSTGRLAWRARRYSTNAASEASSAVISEWSLISSGHRDCCSSSARMFLSYALQGLTSRSKE